jgi:hypothetical protein
MEGINNMCLKYNTQKRHFADKQIRKSHYSRFGEIILVVNSHL